MDIPTLPTDNLYKFMAISGLVIMIIGFLIIWSDANRSQELFRQFQEGVATIKAHHRTAKFVEDEEAGSRLLHEARVQAAQLTAIGKEIEFILEQRPTVVDFFSSCIALGTVLSLSGFWLWYVRVQRYLDRILKGQASGA